MKQIFTLAILFTPILNFSYNPFIHVRSKIKIEQLLVLPPVLKMSIVGKGGRSQIDFELSKKIFYKTGHTLEKGFHDSVKATFFLPDSIAQLSLISFVTKVNNEINNEKQARKYQIPDSIIKLFDASQKLILFFVQLTWVSRGQEKTWLIHTRQRKLLTY